MAKLTITPKKSGFCRLSIPPSKSHTMRALLFGSLGRGTTVVENFLDASDTHAMVEALRAFGIVIHREKNSLVVEGGKLKPALRTIYAGNSGQILRFVAALSALIPAYTVITGDHSVRHRRPVEPLVSALNQLGAFATTTQGKAPITVRGPIMPGKATLHGADSQPVSGLLMATSFLEGKSQLQVINPEERPWIELSLFWIRKLGGKVEHQNYEQYLIEGGLSYEGFHTVIPGDFSSAAFPLVAALIARVEIILEGLDIEDCQGDKKIFSLLSSMGATFEIEKNSIYVKKCPSLRGATIDINDCIDALPIIAVLCCFAESKSEIINAKIARNKESDRLYAICLELKKMGACIEEKEGGLIIYPSQLYGASLYSHEDHRIAMALIVAASVAHGQSVLSSYECIAKSYPSFIEDFPFCDFNRL